MYRARVIPTLLLSERGLVKTRKFKDPVYIGDPINAVRIFNEKEVDELVVLDINASREDREPDYEIISEIASECFMPVAYGGGIRTLEQIRKLLRAGVEKVVINSALAESTKILTEASKIFGSQAIMAGLDVRRGLLTGYKVAVKSASIELKYSVVDYARNLEEAGAGEILLNNVDRDGTMAGYDIDLLRLVSGAVKIPVVAAGGAGTVEHLGQALNDGGAAAVAAGAMFVFRGKHRAVLIGYLTEAQKKELLIRKR
ncbi:imidazole glycerol phosphate synthase subunit HisF [Variovorax sp. RO1]|uniref:AglZ/HisF2 family acetamidino modification protein n=1 Tax=Variovorax sp. RO1 TaxID=2066034 RepID=UPI000C71640A|nr:AglZ/HisF2 family acetamidino modification protein [Variovorax sp. RO1]PLC05124.1 imidazole glycerol phosphate synthase subunit HisF [Variovorax sp. RO1]